MTPAGSKRALAMDDNNDAAVVMSQEQAASPFLAMFEVFRRELDEHHDRRERVIKASRDITALSKKM